MAGHNEGRARYARSAKGRARGSRPATKKQLAAEYGRERFHVLVRRPRGGVRLSDIDLDPLVSVVEWGREGAIMRGSLTLNVPGQREIPGLVTKGDIVRMTVQASDGAPFRPLWEMTVTTPTQSIAAGQVELAMRSRLQPAQQSRSNWRYRTDKSHPKGWDARQVTVHAAKRFSVKLGNLPAATHKFAKLVDKAASVLEIVTQAWTKEREWSGRRFDVSVARGVLDVTELYKPRYMLLMGQQLIDAVIDEALVEPFASALVLSASVKTKGSKKRRKLKVRVVDRARVRRYGYIVRNVTTHNEKLDTPAELRRYARKLLAHRGSTFKTATLTHPGIPWVDRGAGVRVELPQAAVSADAYVTAVQHRLSAGSYEMDLTVTVDNPYERDERKARVARQKAAKARARKRPGATKAARRKPAKAGSRGG